MHNRRRWNARIPHQGLSQHLTQIQHAFPELERRYAGRIFAEEHLMVEAEFHAALAELVPLVRHFFFFFGIWVVLVGVFLGGRLSRLSQLYTVNTTAPHAPCTVLYRGPMLEQPFADRSADECL